MNTAARELLNAQAMEKVLRGMARAFRERHPDLSECALVGIRTRGVFLARRLQAFLLEDAGQKLPLGVVDITLYRDDLTTVASKPIVKGTDIAFALDGKIILLVDDVLFTGRTIRAALTELADFGRPKKIELAVLVDRGHRELPVAADDTGLRVETTLREAVHVFCRELEGEDKVVLETLAREAS